MTPANYQGGAMYDHEISPAVTCDAIMAHWTSSGNTLPPASTVCDSIGDCVGDGVGRACAQSSLIHIPILAEQTGSETNETQS